MSERVQERERERMGREKNARQGESDSREGFWGLPFLDVQLNPQVNLRFETFEILEILDISNFCNFFR